MFLRKIEYFQGVLFLTTNRKQDFDEAFKSRIHVTISFPELSSPVQSAIWEKLIAANRDRNVTIDDTWNSDVFEALGGLGFNVSGEDLSERNEDRPTGGQAADMVFRRGERSRISCVQLLRMPMLTPKRSALATY